VEIKVADNGEILVKSPGLLKEYYKNPKATAEVLTADGWYHTSDAGFIDAHGHLKIIDRVKDVGRIKGGANDGAMFAPKYVENKLKFFPHIKEVVAYGDQREKVCVMINIDFDAVGNWAERRNLPYAGYTDLAQKPEVYQLIKECVEKVNADLAADALLAGSQVSRFLVLHKELDADDGELTRTNKVRRGFIGDKYQVCWSMHCTAANRAVHRDGGEVRGRAHRQRERHAEGDDPRLCAGQGRRLRQTDARHEHEKKIGDVILDVKNISLRFGGVKALTDISFNVKEHEIRAIIGPNGAGKSSMLNCINGVYTPQEGSITFRGQTFSHMNSRQVAEMGVARTFQNLALFKGMSVIDNIMTGRNLRIKSNLFLQALRIGPAAEREEVAAPRVRRTHHRLPGNPGLPQDTRGPVALRPAKARGPGPRAGHGAAGAAAGRAHGRHERGRKAGHVPLHPRRERRVRHHGGADRARHGRGDGHLRPRGGAGLRQEDRRRHPRRGAQQRRSDQRLSGHQPLRRTQQHGIFS
jgi:hypothetical protein